MRKKWDGKNWGRYRILGTYFQLGALDITQYALRIREWYFCEKVNRNYQSRYYLQI